MTAGTSALHFKTIIKIGNLCVAILILKMGGTTFSLYYALLFQKR